MFPRHFVEIQISLPFGSISHAQNMYCLYANDVVQSSIHWTNVQKGTEAN